MPVYFLELHFPEFVSFEYRARTGRHFGKVMLGALSKRIEMQGALHAGDTYPVDMGGAMLQCTVTQAQPALYDDPGFAVLEPKLGIAPRQIAEVLDIVERLIAMGWE